nr:MAG TPA: hypothetical protein [Caudoviricetes sp.]
MNFLLINYVHYIYIKVNELINKISNRKINFFILFKMVRHL